MTCIPENYSLEKKETQLKIHNKNVRILAINKWICFHTLFCKYPMCSRVVLLFFKLVRHYCVLMKSELFNLLKKKNTRKVYKYFFLVIGSFKNRRKISV